MPPGFLSKSLQAGWVETIVGADARSAIQGGTRDSEEAGFTGFDVAVFVERNARVVRVEL